MVNVCIGPRDHLEHLTFAFTSNLGTLQLSILMIREEVTLYSSKHILGFLRATNLCGLKLPSGCIPLAFGRRQHGNVCSVGDRTHLGLTLI